MSQPPSYASAARLIGGEVAAKQAKPRRTLVDWIKARLVFMLFGGVAFFGFQAYGPGAGHRAVADHVPMSATTGACFRDDGSTAPVSCDRAHTYEVFATAEFVADAPYPGLVAGVVDNPVCAEELARVTGGNPGGRFDQVDVIPSSEAWDAGDRRVVCVLFLADGGRLSTSISRR